MNRIKANNKRGKHKVKSRTEAKRIPTAGDERWRDKLAYTAPSNKRFIQSEGGHTLSSHQSHLTSPAGTRLPHTSTKSVHFIDKRRLEDNIDSSIYNADRGLEKVRPGWLYGRSKPVLVGRHHPGELRPVPRAGSGSDVRYMSTAPEWTPAVQTQTASDVSSQLDGAREASIRFLVEQSSRLDERRKHQQRHRRRPVRRKDDDSQSLPVGREVIGHHLNAIKVINLPDGRNPPLQRVLSLWNKRRSVGFRAGTSVTKHQRARVDDVVEVKEDDSDVRTLRRCHVELGDLRAPEAASQHHRLRKVNKLPTVVSRCSRYHQLLQLPNREPKVPDINTGVSVWSYKRMPTASSDRYEQQYIIQHSRPLVTTPVTPRRSADPDDERLIEPWSPIRIVSEANGLTQSGLGRILASRCPECYIESKIL